MIEHSVLHYMYQGINLIPFILLQLIERKTKYTKIVGLNKMCDNGKRMSNRKNA